MKISAAALAPLFLATGTVAFTAPSEGRKQTTTVRQSSMDEEPFVKKVEMSKALPFVQRPKILDGTLPGDVGFDPFGFAGEDKASLIMMREAELKHCRLAMLAVIGWPLAELLDKPIADTVGLPTALTKTGASPSFLNGGLDKIDPLYWFGVALLAGFVELQNADMRETKGKSYVIGDCGFGDSLMPKDRKEAVDLQTKEIKNGRLAMMAILGFAVQEGLWRTPVVDQTPFFFHPVGGLF